MKNQKDSKIQFDKTVWENIKTNIDLTDEIWNNPLKKLEYFKDEGRISVNEFISYKALVNDVWTTYKTIKVYLEECGNVVLDSNYYDEFIFLKEYIINKKNPFGGKPLFSKDILYPIYKFLRDFQYSNKQIILNSHYINIEDDKPYANSTIIPLLDKFVENLHETISYDYQLYQILDVTSKGQMAYAPSAIRYVVYNEGGKLAEKILKPMYTFCPDHKDLESINKAISIFKGRTIAGYCYYIKELENHIDIRRNFLASSKYPKENSSEEDYCEEDFIYSMNFEEIEKLEDKKTIKEKKDLEIRQDLDNANRMMSFNNCSEKKFEGKNDNKPYCETFNNLYEDVVKNHINFRCQTSQINFLEI